MNSQLSFDDIKSFLRRRKTLFMLTFIVIFSGAISLCVLLPPTYRSQATISITESEISEDYIKSVVAYTPEERVQHLTSAVMNYSQLQKIIKQHHLYPDLQKNDSMNEAVLRIKQDIDIKPVISNVFHSRSGRSVPVTSAIILAYDGEKPEKVKAVTQALANLYIEEDVKKREKLAAATTGFLEDELNRLKKQIQEQAAEISEFKSKHQGSLPENSMSSRQIIARLESDINNIDGRIRLLEDRNIELNGQLAVINPYAPLNTGDQVVIRNPRERLKMLRAELNQLRTRLSDKHPDIVKVKREISEIESGLGIQGGGAENAKNTKYEDLGYNKPDNPAYINILTQIKSTDAEIKSLLASKARAQQQLGQYTEQLKNMPVVETKLNEMMRNYENAKKNYNELMDKLMNARVSQAVEQTDRGAKFKITDPPYLPDKPYKPNRPAIIVLGLVVALGASTALAALKEATDRTIKSEKELSDMVNVPVLTSITFVGKDKKK
jgi:succinoglycan biosynthesis transport protein ExoP